MKFFISYSRGFCELALAPRLDVGHVNKNKGDGL